MQEIQPKSSALEPASAGQIDKVIPFAGPASGKISWVKLLKQQATFANIFMGLLLVVYLFAFWDKVSEYWFHTGWTTDDALQQIYPFHKVFHPEIFRGDLITQMMEGYLPPVHYALCYAVTWLTGDPIMMGHWMTLAQLLLTTGFLFGAVRAATGIAPAIFSVIWFMHTRHVVQRITGGLPRGWAAVVFAAFLYYALKKNHKGILITIFLGCLLHPPGTMIVAISYGMFLCFQLLKPATRAEYKKPFITYVVVSPLFLVTTLLVLKHPPEIGTMASYEEAAAMPEFSRPFGRFPFVPLIEPWKEIKSFGFHAFLGRLYNPGQFLRENMAYMVIGILAVLLVAERFRRRELIPREVLCFGVASLIVYFLSRQFAFKMYVPNRHLQFPLAMFFITAFTIGVWRSFYRTQSALIVEARGGAARVGPPAYQNSHRSRAVLSIFGLVALGTFIYLGSGNGLQGTMNFNYASTKKGGLWGWVKKFTPEDSLIAGHPTLIDGVQLFGMRRGYVTTETSHPFYNTYYREMKRRLEITLRAHYAKDLREFLALVEPEGIDYFVFSRKDFYPVALSNAYYFPPFDVMVKELTSGPQERYAYKMLPDAVADKDSPFLMYKDDYSEVVDIKALKAYLAKTNHAAGISN